MTLIKLILARINAKDEKIRTTFSLRQIFCYNTLKEMGRTGCNQFRPEVSYKSNLKLQYIRPILLWGGQFFKLFFLLLYFFGALRNASFH